MTSIFQSISRELDVFLGFTWRDWSTTLIPGSLFVFSALRGLPLTEAIRNYVLLVLWLSLFVYFFTLSNQITGVEEDKVNKPDRPIPSGKVSMAGAQLRWLIIASAFVGSAAFEPTLLPAIICWVATTASLVLTPVGGNWFWKNTVSMTTGTWALFQGTWRVVAPMTPKIETYIYAVAVWTGLNMQIQDLRDIKGDRAIGRTTLPVIVGDRTSRVIMSFVFIPAAFYVLHVSRLLQLAPVTLSILHLALLYRVLRMGGPRYDHKTYMFFTYIFCAVIALAGNEGIVLDPVGRLMDGLVGQGATKLRPSQAI
ncbi:hypothetical protein DENSPDRAFT_926134 [Dentipellis sp. KUC8613]|nr:hypothetical protein DENSPDRAFT_926134 [Dentipellis sp. KUC8613]